MGKVGEYTVKLKYNIVIMMNFEVIFVNMKRYGFLFDKDKSLSAMSGVRTAIFKDNNDNYARALGEGYRGTGEIMGNASEYNERMPLNGEDQERMKRISEAYGNSIIKGERSDLWIYEGPPLSDEAIDSIKKIEGVNEVKECVGPSCVNKDYGCCFR